MDAEGNGDIVGDSSTDSQINLPKPTKTIKSAKFETHHCRWCCSPLSLKARVCPTCGRHQRRLWNYFSQGLLFVSTFISIIMVGISVVNVSLTKRNLNLAEQERIKAAEALTIAQSATTEALRAKNVASAAQSMLDDLSLIVDVNAAAISAPQDVHSLRKLFSISHYTNDRVRVLAEKQLEVILNQLRADFEMVKSDYWGFNGEQDAEYYGFEDDMKSWRRVEFVNNYLKVPFDRRIVYVMQFLSDSKETDDEKLLFSYSVLQLESRPDVIYTICDFVNEKAKINKDYLYETEHYMRWLKTGM